MNFNLTGFFSKIEQNTGKWKKILEKSGTFCQSDDVGAMELCYLFKYIYVSGSNFIETGWNHIPISPDVRRVTL